MQLERGHGRANGFTLEHAMVVDQKKREGGERWGVSVLVLLIKADDRRGCWDVGEMIKATGVILNLKRTRRDVKGITGDGILGAPKVAS